MLVLSREKASTRRCYHNDNDNNDNDNTYDTYDNGTTNMMIMI